MNKRHYLYFCWEIIHVDTSARWNENYLPFFTREETLRMKVSLVQFEIQLSGTKKEPTSSFLNIGLLFMVIHVNMWWWVSADEEDCASGGSSTYHTGTTEPLPVMMCCYGATHRHADALLLSAEDAGSKGHEAIGGKVPWSDATHRSTMNTGGRHHFLQIIPHQ